MEETLIMAVSEVVRLWYVNGSKAVYKLHTQKENTKDYERLICLVWIIFWCILFIYMQKKVVLFL